MVIVTVPTCQSSQGSFPPSHSTRLYMVTSTSPRLEKHPRWQSRLVYSRVPSCAQRLQRRKNTKFSSKDGIDSN